MDILCQGILSGASPTRGKWTVCTRITACTITPLSNRVWMKGFPGGSTHLCKSSLNSDTVSKAKKITAIVAAAAEWTEKWKGRG